MQLNNYYVIINFTFKDNQSISFFAILTLKNKYTNFQNCIKYSFDDK